jgi:hypothetical protein
MIPCPDCGSHSIGSDGYCSICGYGVDTTTKPRARSVAKSSQAPSNWLKPIGSALVGLGVFVTAFGFLSSGAPSYSDTLNIGLLNDKTNLVLIGGFMFVSGIICLAVETAILRVLTQSQDSPAR